MSTKASLHIIILLLVSFCAFSQETNTVFDYNKEYKRGLELFDHGNILAAKKVFEKVADRQINPAETEHLLIKSNASYYEALCASKLNNLETEKLFLDFIKNSHETQKRRLAYFHLGTYYYKEKKFTNAIAYLEKVETDDLTNDEVVEYNFQLAYSYFVRKKFNKAKPLFDRITNVQHKYFYPSNYYSGFIAFYEGDYPKAKRRFEQIKDTKMYRSAVPYYLAQIYYFEKDYDKVITYSNDLLENPNVKNKNELSHLVGQAYFQKKQFEQAIPYLKEYVDNARKVSKEDIYQLAYAQYQVGKYEDAIVNFKDLNVVKDTLGQNALFALADCYLKTDKKDEARNAYQQAYKYDFDPLITQVALINYGRLSYELNYQTEAVNTAKAFMNLYPQSNFYNDAVELLANALLATKNYDDAIKTIEDISPKTPSLNAAYQRVTYFRAVELHKSGKNTDALAMLDKSLNYTVDLEIEALSYYTRGDIRYKQKKYDLAVTEYRNYAQIAKSKKVQSDQASVMRAYYNIAYAYLKKKDYKSAITWFNDALKQYKYSSDIDYKDLIALDASLRLGDSYYMLKNYSSAIKHYNKVIEKNIKKMDYAYYQIAKIQGFQGKYNSKISSLNTLTRQYPTSTYVDNALFDLGSTYQMNGKNSDAISSYNNLIANYENSPLRPRSYLQVGLINYNSGNNQQALNNYKEVIKQYPNSGEAVEALKIMKEIYVAMGNPDGYIDFINNSPDLNISASAQDSLYFLSAEESYQLGDCNAAVSGLNNYLSKFPRGYFALKAHYYRGECLFKAEKFVQSFGDYEYVIDKKPNDFIENSLSKAAWMAYYKIENYSKAKRYYKELYVLTSYSSSNNKVLMGLLRSCYKLDDHNEVIQYATSVVTSDLSTENEKIEARYYKGKSAFEKGNYAVAQTEFALVAANSNSEWGAESAFKVANIYYINGDYQTSLDKCFEVKDNFGGYDLWLVKAFMLMAENYVKMDNIFQAKATLQSIVDNYTGDQALLNQARKRLKELEEMEKQGSKIQMNGFQNDSTLIMDDY